MAARTPFRDNTRLIVLGIVALLALLAGLLTLAGRSARLAPDVLTESVLYALSATNLTFLVALVFVLARNIIKLVVERRRALPFARFRATLVAVLLGMTLVPAVLVLLVGGELIRNSVDRWFNAPMDEVLSTASTIAGDYYQERQRLVAVEARRLGRQLAGQDLSADPGAFRAVIEAPIAQERTTLVELYRLGPVKPGPETAPAEKTSPEKTSSEKSSPETGRTAAPGPGTPGATRPRAQNAGARAPTALHRVTEAVGEGLPREYQPVSADRLAERTLRLGVEQHAVEQIAGQGELVRAAVPIRSGPNGAVRGVVITSEYLTGAFATQSRRLTRAYEDYLQLRVLKQPLTGVYLSFFLMLTLMILVGATWMGLYLAKRITRPVQMLAVAAREIGAGHFEHRLTPEGRDEFGSLIDAFNRMAGDLAASRRDLERSALELEQTHREVEGRRQYVETVLDRVATGVVSIDAAGHVRTANRAAVRLLGLTGPVDGRPVAEVLADPGLRPLVSAIAERVPGDAPLPPGDVTIVREGREVNLAVLLTRLRADAGGVDGLVVVFDDVTPLVRAQKVAAWREVARRLAHEIKNPLTPIQLCAERLRRHFGTAPEPTRALVEECTTTIVDEVESLKGLVDEFSQFARMPAPRAVPTDLDGLIGDALGLYRGLFTQVTIRTRLVPGLPRVTLDPEQIRRVLINLVDNAVEAMGRQGTIEIETQLDRGNSLVRVIVADDGPGIPPEEREKLFLPYYSTKRRGSGLGLAIVRRIVAEHGGSIEVDDNVPRGTRFAIELPCEVAA